MINILKMKSNVNLFIESLKNKIIIDEKKVEQLTSQKNDIQGLIDYIKNLQILTNNEQKIKCDIGNGVYINAKLNNIKTKKILINIGQDVYVDLSYVEAIDNLLHQEKIIDKKLILLNNELIKNKAYVKLTKGINQTLKKHQILEGNLVSNEENVDENLDNNMNY